jgi:beta-mannosidase
MFRITLHNAMSFIISFLLLTIVIVHAQPIILDLDGRWQANNANGSISIGATVPGQIHTDLMAAGKIGDPYFRFNDVNYRWIAYDNWYAKVKHFEHR